MSPVATQAMDGERAIGSVDVLITGARQGNSGSFEDWWNRADEIVDGQL
jgi:hypothetical protein